jgi:hypothetical protein
VLEQAATQAVQLSAELEMEAETFQDLLGRMKDSQLRMQSINRRLIHTNTFVQNLKEQLNADTGP